MKQLSEKRALEKLHRLKSEFTARIRSDFEHRAKSCATCDTPGACCLDAHFVNVHITRLEAVTIRDVIDAHPNRDAIRKRVDEAIAKYGLAIEGDTFSKTYACPLFEKGIGCLVHERGKPLPCIAHACYENKEDLPPDELLAEEEQNVMRLDELVYRHGTVQRPLPVAVSQSLKAKKMR